MTSSTALTVMMVTPNLDIGGAQEITRTLASYLPTAGCPTVVCTFRDGPVRRDIEDLGVHVEILPERRHSVLALPLFAAEMLRRRRDLSRLIHRHAVDVVQTHALGTLDFLVATLGIGRRVQIWWTIHNVLFMVREEKLQRNRWLLRPKRAAHRTLYRIGARLVDGILAVSDDAARSFRETVGYRGNKLTVVLNGVDVERYPAPIDREEVRARLGFGPNDHLITMVGTFKRQKGHRYLVEAAVRVLPRHRGSHILLIGDGELATTIATQVHEAGLDGRIHLLGGRRDVPELLAASDAFILPSLWEGMSVALLEAMASGLPVIATEVSGTIQVMLDRRTGWLVPPGDSVALSRAMDELLADPVRAATMASAARKRVVDAFSARRQAEQLAALFRLGDRAQPRPEPAVIGR